MFDLDQHPDIRMKGEVMGVPLLPKLREQTDDNRLEWLRRWWADAPRARGFKFQFNRSAPQFDDLPRLAQEIQRICPVIFRLGRRDRVRHAVSVLRAEALLPIAGRAFGHEFAHIRTSDPEEMQAFRRQPIAIDLDAFRYLLEAIETNVRYMDGFLADFEDVREITYEDYHQDRLGVLNTVAAAVGVEPFGEAPPATLHKISSDDLRGAVTNYDELAAAAAELGFRA